MKSQLPRILLLLILVIGIPRQAQSQPDWREQPKWFGIGITVGIAGATKVNTGTIMAGAAISKTAFDLQRGAQIDPFTAGYGAFIGATTRLKLKKRKRVTK